MEEPSTPQKGPSTPDEGAIITPETIHGKVKQEVGLGSPIGRPLFTGVDAGGTATPAQSSPIRDAQPGKLASSPVLSSSPTSKTPQSLSFTPGRTTRYPASPHFDRPWHSTRVPSSSGRVSLRDSKPSIPPVPLATMFLRKEDIASLPDDKVRDELAKALDEVSMYERAAHQFRSMASNYLLQNKLLTIETHESMQRHEVETNLAKKEVQRLAVDANGYSEGVESLTRKLKRTRLRVRELESQLSDRDRELRTLKRQLQDLEYTRAPVLPAMKPMNEPSLTVNTTLARQSSANLQNPREPLSGLDILASQALDQELAQHSTGPKDRRPSSSSTISQHSADETFEDPNQSMG
ncbi:hypothetical protein B9G98_03140 [Wickerhamiella sorbophila]|uniref:Uncharacterized protein n=1 Tax=Wickerhamiella sorbophila TaxID=45607 RepID=A0A2T0FKL4_9ASCO|nr:hypothetical protein B9G98_03140 [Wickerhamiella sorbophila]PRT55520.1 hypothetical protein B9G98_03140 [Wickerhamiella sorbophila]